MWNPSVMRMLMLLIVSFALAWSPMSQAAAAVSCAGDCDCVHCPMMQSGARDDENAPSRDDSQAPCAMVVCAACTSPALPAMTTELLAPHPSAQAKAFGYDRIAMEIPSLDPPIPR